MLQQGKGVREVARSVGASSSSVSRWKKQLEESGETGLAAKKQAGRESRLKEEQKEQLGQILLQGAVTAGYTTELWTLGRVAEVIEREFGVRYHPGHVWRILRKLGWSCQKPERRARERDEAAIAQWRQAEWPRIKKVSQRGEESAADG